MNRLYTKFLSVVVMTVSVLVLISCAKTPERAERAQPIRLAGQATEPNAGGRDVCAKLCEEEWGIRIEKAALSAAGYMVDFRFRVLDAVKAAPILDRAAKPQLIAQATGASLTVPAPAKIGQLRSGGNVKDGHVCFIMFSNSARQVRSGEKVTVVVGDFQVQDIVVQ
jgi:hypothetical protein